MSQYEQIIDHFVATNMAMEYVQSDPNPARFLPAIERDAAQFANAFLKHRTLESKRRVYDVG